MALPSNKKLQAKKWDLDTADAVYSMYIRARDTHCYFCSNPASQNSHYWGRANMGTRFNDDNCDGICGGCHMRHEGNKQGLYRDKKLAQLGKERYRELEQLARGSSIKRNDAIASCREAMQDFISIYGDIEY